MWYETLLLSSFNNFSASKFSGYSLSICSTTPIANFTLPDLAKSTAKFKTSIILPGLCIIFALGPRLSIDFVYITEAPFLMFFNKSGSAICEKEKYNSITAVRRNFTTA